MAIVSIETAIVIKCSFVKQTIQKKSGFCSNALSAHLQNKLSVCNYFYLISVQGQCDKDDVRIVTFNDL